MTLLVCSQLPQMQCVRNGCLHMDMYNLQDYIIAKISLYTLYQKMVYSCSVGAMCNLSILSPIYRECFKGSNKVGFFFFLYLSINNVCPRYLSYEYFEFLFLSFSNSYVLCVYGTCSQLKKLLIKSICKMLCLISTKITFSSGENLNFMVH